MILTSQIYIHTRSVHTLADNLCQKPTFMFSPANQSEYCNQGSSC